MAAPPARCARALRWARVVWYAGFAPAFLAALRVHLVMGRRSSGPPMPGSVGFGRDTVFLTFHCTVHCVWYSLVCLALSVQELAPAAGAARRRRGRVARAAERAAHAAPALLFPLAAVVGAAYYAVVHFHPMSRARARQTPGYDASMALLHVAPAAFAAGDALLKDVRLARRHGLSRRAAARTITAYGIAYYAWSCFCVYMNGGHWPYPFQKRFTLAQHVAFVAAILVITQFVTRFGFTLIARIDRRYGTGVERSEEAGSDSEPFKLS